MCINCIYTYIYMNDKIVKTHKEEKRNGIIKSKLRINKTVYDQGKSSKGSGRVLGS